MFVLKMRSDDSGMVSVTLNSVADAISYYETFRDSSNLGASELSNGKVYDGSPKNCVAEISYNGRAWQPGQVGKVEFRV